MSSLAKRNSVMDHFKNKFRDKIIPDYNSQMVKWGNSNGELILLATEAQGKWRGVLEAARLRKKAEDARDEAILQLVLGIGTGVAFGFLSSAVQAKIGYRFRSLQKERVFLKVGDVFRGADMSRLNYNHKLGQLVGSVIEQFEDKGGIQVVGTAVGGNSPDYFSALNEMHNDFTTIKRMEKDLEKAWRTTANKGAGVLHFLIDRASEEWCDRMFLRPANGSVSKAKVHVEDFLVRLTNLLRHRIHYWGNNPLIRTAEMRENIERDIWAIWAITKAPKLHKQRVRMSGTGLSVYPARPSDPWNALPNIGRDYAKSVYDDPATRLMFKAEHEVTDRLAHLSVALPQNDKHRKSLEKRNVTAGRVALRGDIDTPDEYMALIKWAAGHLKGKTELAPKAQSYPRPPISSLDQLNHHGG
ncbi:MAG: hypothetical protein AAGB11_07160 [Pseudomonadota bacterium]